MVENRITDGRRIAQFLASELTGLQMGALAHVKVVEAVRDAEPTPEGTRAYRIDHDGELVGSVVMFPDFAEVRLADGWAWVQQAQGGDVTVEADALTVRSVAAVKQAVDALGETIESVTEE